MNQTFRTRPASKRPGLSGESRIDMLVDVAGALLGKRSNGRPTTVFTRVLPSQAGA